MALNNSQIVNFFRNQTIFITGGTGMLGKLLIEKLLRVCEDLDRIYVLIRPKYGKSPEQRFEEIFSDPCFDLVKDNKYMKKIHLVSGDCRKPLLGLKIEDVEILREETTCVFHVAATVKFDQTLKEASYNVLATREILELIKQMKMLKAFVFVSTAFSNCVHSHIKEDFYEPPLNPEDFLTLIKALDDETLTKVTPYLLGDWPNTYVYSKSISEDLIRKTKTNVPVAIVRPSTVTNCYEEPFKGWIGNAYGYVGVIASALMGVLKSFRAAQNKKVHWIPADFTCSCILAAAWKTATGKSNFPTIYNAVGRPLPVPESEQLIHRYYWDYPSHHYLWYNTFKTRESRFWQVVNVRLNIIPFYVMNLILYFLGKPANAVRRYKYINKVFDLVSYFVLHEWTFDESNVNNLWNEMNEEDRKIFNFDTKILDVNEYFRNCALGIRLFLFRDPLETLPRGRNKLKILFVVHYVTVALLCYLSFKFFTFLINCFI